MQYMIQQHADKHVVFLAMSVALLLQQYIKFLEMTSFPRDRVGLFYGTKTSREESVEDLKVIFATPVVYSQMLAARQCHIHHCSLLIFDEVHHARKKHPYAKIMKDNVLRELPLYRPRVFGMSASPGEGNSLQETLSSFDTLCATMSAELTVPLDPVSIDDLRGNTTQTETIIEIYDQSPLDTTFLQTVTDYLISTIKQLLALDRSDQTPFDSTPESKALEESISASGGYHNPASAASCEELRRIGTAYNFHAHLIADLRLYSSVVSSGEQAMKINEELPQRIMEIVQILRDHTDALLPYSMLQSIVEAWETLADIENFGADQTHRSTLNLFCLLKTDGMALKSNESLAATTWNQLKSECAARIQNLQINQSGNGKVSTVLKYLNTMSPKSRAVVFVQMRSTAASLAKYLSSQLPETIGVDWLVGRSEMTASNQISIVERFNQGDFQVLVATSVGEEGIDIQACDLVIRLDGTTTAKSLIQSRGRARRQNSRYVLITQAENKPELEFVMKKEELMMMAVRHRCDPEGLRRDGIDIQQLFEQFKAQFRENASSPAAWIAVHEYCQQHRLSLPFFDYTQNDATPNTRFTCTSTFSGKNFRASASTKSDAKFLVAASIWAHLSKIPSEPGTPVRYPSPIPSSPLGSSGWTPPSARVAGFAMPPKPESLAQQLSPEYARSVGVALSSFMAQDSAQGYAAPVKQDPFAAQSPYIAVPSSSQAAPTNASLYAPSMSAFHAGTSAPQNTLENLQRLPVGGVARGSVRPRLPIHNTHLQSSNSIGALQELCQQAGCRLPEYEELGQDPNSGEFVASCKFYEVTAHGYGRQKKMSKTEAATAMLKELYRQQQGSS